MEIHGAWKLQVPEQKQLWEQREKHEGRMPGIRVPMYEEGALNLFLSRPVSLRVRAPSCQWRSSGCFQDLLPALTAALQGGTGRDGVCWKQPVSLKSQGLLRVTGNRATGHEKVWKKSCMCVKPLSNLSSSALHHTFPLHLPVWSEDSAYGDDPCPVPLRET